MRAALYVRISRDREGQALGVGRQEQDGRALAAHRGWQVEAVYSDNDTSAAAYRPEFERLLADIEACRVEAIVAYSSSRLYRDVDVDKARLFKACQSNGRVAIATVASGDIDAYSADGRLIANLLASVDQAERERTSERRRRQLAEKRSRNEWHGGHRPYGYRVEGKHLVVDPTEAATIRDAARRLLAGESGGSLVRAWAIQGIRTPHGGDWTAWNLRALMTRGTPQGASEPIIGEPDTEALRALYKRRKTGKRREGRHLLTGLAYCGTCGRKMIHRPNNGHRLYMCWDSTTGKVETRISAGDLEHFVVEEAGRRYVPSTALVDVNSPKYEERQRIVAEMDELAYSDLPLRMLEKRGAKLQAELDRLDRELRHYKTPNREAESQQWAYLQGFPFGDLQQDPQARAWLQTLIESITIEPVEGNRRTFTPERVAIDWREGVLEAAR